MAPKTSLIVFWGLPAKKLKNDANLYQKGYPSATRTEGGGGGGVVGCRCWVNIKDLTGLISQHGIGTEYLSKNRLFFPLLRYTNWALSCPEMTQKGVTWLNYGKKKRNKCGGGRSNVSLAALIVTQLDKASFPRYSCITTFNRDVRSWIPTLCFQPSVVNMFHCIWGI